MKLDRTHYICIAGGIALGILVSLLWSTRGDVGSCAIENMRGQPSSMQRAIVAYCIERYGDGE